MEADGTKIETKIKLNDMGEIIYKRMMLIFKKNKIEQEQVYDVNKIKTHTYLLSIHPDDTGTFSIVPVDTFINQMEKLMNGHTKYSAILVEGPFHSSNFCSLENVKSHVHANWKITFQLTINNH
jgi:peroxiredoxin